MSKITLENVSFEYSPKTSFSFKALRDISVDIEEGKITGIIGHTGSGKSTFVQLLNGLLKPTEGKVLIDGKDIWENPKKIRDIRFRVGLVMQYPEYQLFDETVRKDIEYGPKNKGMTPEEIEKNLQEAIQLVDVSPSVLDSSPFDLSGGQKRRIAIAGILAMKPEILVLDEPASGLDPKGKELIFEGIKKYNETNSSTVIIVSHSMEDVAKYCDNLIVINQGVIAASGPVREVFAKEDLLHSCGLEVPQITLLMHLLKNKGLAIDDSVYTVREAADVILNYYKS